MLFPMEIGKKARAIIIHFKRENVYNLKNQFVCISIIHAIHKKRVRNLMFKRRLLLAAVR
jgi:hypothetical protein